MKGKKELTQETNNAEMISPLLKDFSVCVSDYNGEKYNTIEYPSIYNIIDSEYEDTLFPMYENVADDEDITNTLTKHVFYIACSRYRITLLNLIQSSLYALDKTIFYKYKKLTDGSIASDVLGYILYDNSNSSIISKVINHMIKYSALKEDDIHFDKYFVENTIVVNEFCSDMYRIIHESLLVKLGTKVSDVEFINITSDLNCIIASMHDNLVYTVTRSIQTFRSVHTDPDRI